MLAAFHVSTTGVSLYNEQAAMYWTASPDDLTDEGHKLYEALELVYEIKPLLLTFLAT